MNEDRIIGAGRNAAGALEKDLGNAIGSDRLVGDGLIDQVAGAFQHGYGKARDTVSISSTKRRRRFGAVTDRARDLGRQADHAVRRGIGR